MITKVKQVLVRLYQRLRITKYKFLSTAKNIKGNCNIVQPVLFSGNGTIEFGKDVCLGTKQSPCFYSGYCFLDARKNNAKIIFGDGVWSNNNLTIISQEAGVMIGANTLIGTNVEIYDSDFHHVDPTRRRDADVYSSRVEIGENVWIGSNVKILKGAKIGANSIIGNNSLVIKDLPADAICGGSPAIVLKKIVQK